MEVGLLAVAFARQDRMGWEGTGEGNTCLAPSRISQDSMDVRTEGEGKTMVGNPVLVRSTECMLMLLTTVEEAARTKMFSIGDKYLIISWLPRGLCRPGLQRL